MDNGLITRKEAAEILGITQSRMYQWEKEKGIKPAPTERQWNMRTCYRREDIEAIKKVYRKGHKWEFVPPMPGQEVIPEPQPIPADQGNPKGYLSDSLLRLFKPILDWATEAEAKLKHFEHEVHTVQHKYQEANELFNGVVEERNRLKGQLAAIEKTFKG